jgi:hypothetical protein
VRLCCGALALILGSVVAASAQAQEVTRSANNFRQSVCFNTHFHYSDTPYGNHDEVIRALNRIGTGLTIRDGVAANRPDQIAGWTRAWDEGGHRVVVNVDPRSGSLDSLWAPLEDLPNLRAVEGPNEYNSVVPDSWQYVTPPRAQYVFLQDWMRQLVAHRDQAGLDVPVIDWSPTTWQSAQEAKDASTINGPRPAVDLGNIHSYSAGRNAAPGGVNQDSGWHSDIETGRNLYVYDVHGRGAPWVITETGYHTSLVDPGPDAPIGDHHGVPESVQSAYLVNSLLEGYWFQAWDNPHPLTCVYELIDGSCPNCAGPENNPAVWHRENNFGVFRRDYTAKLAVAHIRNLLRALTITGDKDAPLTWMYDLTGPNGPAGYDFRFFSLRRGDGRKVVAIWRADSLWDRDLYQERHPAPKVARLSVGAQQDFDVIQPAVSSASLRTCRGSAVEVSVRAETPTLIVVGPKRIRNPGAC